MNFGRVNERGENMISESVQDFFTTLATRHYVPLLHSISGTIQWNIEGEGQWNAIINKGIVTGDILFRDR